MGLIKVELRTGLIWFRYFQNRERRASTVHGEDVNLQNINKLNKESV